MPANEILGLFRTKLSCVASCTFQSAFTGTWSGAPDRSAKAPDSATLLNEGLPLMKLRLLGLTVSQSDCVRSCVERKFAVFGRSAVPNGYPLTLMGVWLRCR
jgi:hypothetical protein